MRKLLLLLCFIALVLMRANAQWEKIIKVNTGTAEFTGRNATGGTFINEGYGGKSYSNSPTGTKKGLLFEAGAAIQHHSKFGLLIGAGAGYQFATEKQDVYNVVNPASSSIGPAVTGPIGSVSLRNQFVILKPYLGWRIPLGKCKLDLSAGFEYAPWIRSHEKGSAHRPSDNKDFYLDADRSHSRSEFRSGFELNLIRKKTGISFGYAKALTNYYEGWIGGSPEAFAQYLKIGIMHKL